MSLYPSLEALTIGKEVEAQNKLAVSLMASPAASTSSGYGVNYAALANEFLGLDLSMISYDEYGNAVYVDQPGPGAVMPSAGSAIAPASVPRDPVAVSHSVREIKVSKDPKGFVGLQLRDQDCGVFVSYVQSDSPASVAGLRFGDQVLKINDKVVAGMSGKDAMNFIRKQCCNTFVITIRDRLVLWLL